MSFPNISLGYWLWLLWMALVLSLFHEALIEQGHTLQRTQFHKMMMQGQAPAPEQYRLLPFLAAETLRRVTHIKLASVYFLLRFLGNFISLVFMLKLGLRWMKPEKALVGCLVLSLLLLTTYHSYTMKPGDPWFLVFWIAGLIAVLEGRFGALLAWSFLAMWTRETAWFLLLAWILLSGETEERPCAGIWKRMKVHSSFRKKTALLTGLLGGAYLLPRVIYWNAQPYTAFWQWNTNVHGGTKFLVVLIFLGGLGVSAYGRWRRVPRELQLLSWVIPPYILLHLFVGIAWETRLYGPIFPLVVLMGLCSFFHGFTTHREV